MWGEGCEKFDKAGDMGSNPDALMYDTCKTDY